MAAAAVKRRRSTDSDTSTVPPQLIWLEQELGRGQPLEVEEEEVKEVAPSRPRARGRGTFGCVVGPPIPQCAIPQSWEQDDPRTPKISKLYFLPQQEQREWTLVQLVREQADPEFKFTPRIYGHCGVARADANLYVGCHPTGIATTGPAFQQSFVQQLVMEDAGLSWEALPKPLPLRTFLTMCRSAAAHLQHLNEVGQLLHNDIKPDNILYQPATQKVTIIDFSLLMLAQKTWGHWKEQPMSPPEWTAWIIMYYQLTFVVPLGLVLSIGTALVADNPDLAKPLSGLMSPQKWRDLRVTLLDAMIYQRARTNDMELIDLKIRYSEQILEYIDWIGATVPVASWRSIFEQQQAFKSDLYSLGRLMVRMLRRIGNIAVTLEESSSILNILQSRMITPSPLMRWDWEAMIAWLDDLLVSFLPSQPQPPSSSSRTLTLTPHSKRQRRSSAPLVPR